MAGISIVKGSQPVEYVEENSFADGSDTGTSTWKWFGLVDSFSATEGVETSSVRYLPEHGSSSKLEDRVNVALSETWEGEVTYAPQDFTTLKYWTGSDGATSDSLQTIQIGEVDEDNGEYRRLLGGVGEEFALSVSENSVAEVTGSFMFADGEDWTETDYIADTEGSHATEVTTEPLSYGDLSNVQLGGTELSDAIESLDLTISNELTTVKDPDSSRGSHIEAIVPTNREITVELGLTYSNFDMAQTVRDYTKQDLTFDLGTTSFTVSDVQFPEFTHELSAEDLVADSVSSDPASTISWTSSA